MISCRAFRTDLIRFLPGILPLFFYSYRKPYSLTHPVMLYQLLFLHFFLLSVMASINTFRFLVSRRRIGFDAWNQRRSHRILSTFGGLFPMDFLKLLLFLPGVHRSNLLMVSSVFSVHPISISYFSFIILIVYLAPCFMESIWSYFSWFPFINLSSMFPSIRFLCFAKLRNPRIVPRSLQAGCRQTGYSGNRPRSFHKRNKGYSFLCSVPSSSHPHNPISLLRSGSSNSRSIPHLF